MSEFQFPYYPNLALDLAIFSPDGDSVFNAVTRALELRAVIATHWGQSVIRLIDPSNLGLYSATVPVELPANTSPYIASVSRRIDLSNLSDPNTATINDPKVGIGSFVWNGVESTGTVTIPTSSLTSVESADLYFAGRLYAQSWIAADANKKQAALNQATDIVNSFAYLGTKTISNQPHQFPRSGLYLQNTPIPSDSIPPMILKAYYEIAIQLVKGIDPEREIRNLAVTSRGYSSVRTTYDPNLASEHLRWGVPSGVAWLYLSAFLDRGTSGGVRIHRVS